MSEKPSYNTATPLSLLLSPAQESKVASGETAKKKWEKHQPYTPHPAPHTCTIFGFCNKPKVGKESYLCLTMYITWDQTFYCLIWDFGNLMWSQDVFSSLRMIRKVMRLPDIFILAEKISPHPPYFKDKIAL